MTADSKADSQSDSEQRQTVQLIDAMLDELSAMARDKQSIPADFFSRVVEQLFAILDPLSASLWIIGPDDQPVIVRHRTSPEWDARFDSIVAERINSIVASGETNTDPIRTTKLACTPFFSVIESREKNWGVLSICLPGIDEVSGAYGRILDAVAEICTEFLTHQQSAKIGETTQYWENLLRFSLTSHASLNDRELAHQIANDARLLLECDRVTLFRTSGTGPKLLAVSSVAVVESKTRSARMLKRIASAAFRAKRPIFSHEENLPPRLRNQLDQFQNESGLDFTAIVPICKPNRGGKSDSQRVIGAMVVEAVDDSNQIEVINRLNQVVPHVNLGFANARVFSSIPMRRPLSAFGYVMSAFRLGNLPKTLIVLAIISAITCALLFFKMDMNVRVDGELRPAIQRNVFAPMDSVVDEILVRHGDPVKQGTLLAKLSSPELELELKRIAGELKSVESRVETKKIAMNQAATGNVGDQVIVSQLAGEIADLEQEKLSLESQQKLLTAKRDRLKVVSEIDGEVISWKAEKTLDQRPIHRGDVMLRIADVNGEWNLVFEVPEHRVGYLLQRQQELLANDIKDDDQMTIEFFLEANPAKTYTGKVIEFAESTSTTEAGQTVTMICDASAEEIEQLRLGASVIGKVNCGKRSVGYVWTFELIDSIRRRLVW